MRLVTTAGLTALLLLGLGGRASAAPLAVNGGWHGLEWACGEGSLANPLGSCENPSANTEFSPLEFTFELGPLGGWLYFTDLYVSGDEFTVVIKNLTSNVTETAATSDVPNPGFLQLGESFDWYLSSGEFSTLSLFLPEGTFAVSFELLDLAPCLVPGDACGDPLSNPPLDWIVGDAALRVDGDAVVPEPASMVLLGSGLVGIGAAVRRRRQRVLSAG